MSRRMVVAVACAMALLGCGSALAQGAGVEEIVVSGSLAKDYSPTETPQVVLPKRADNLFTRVRVVCDTRDLSQRRSELRATLLNMIRAAKQDPRIALGIGDEVVGDFNETMLDTVIVPDAKVDTSRATVLIKTRIAREDTFDAATSRIKAFVERTQKVGRTEILIDRDWELTLINPNQYRPEVAKLIAEDAQRMARLFGDGYGVEVNGLQLPVSWYQSGPLDLALFIPYRLNVRPKGP